MLKLSIVSEYRSKDTEHCLEEDLLEVALSDKKNFQNNPSLLAQFLLKHDVDISIVPISFEDSDDNDELELPCTD